MYVIKHFAIRCSAFYTFINNVANPQCHHKEKKKSPSGNISISVVAYDSTGCCKNFKKGEETVIKKILEFF